MKKLCALLILVPATALAAPLPEDAAFQLRGWLLERINSSRAEHDLPLLLYSKEVERVAQLHAKDTADAIDLTNTKTREATYLAHTSSDGRSIGERYADADVQTGWGYAENTGYWTRPDFAVNDSDQAFLEATTYGLKLMHEGMMAEVPPNDSHRRNILGPYTHVGIGLSLFAGRSAKQNAIFLVSNFSRYVSAVEEKTYRARTLQSALLIPKHGGPFLDVRPEHTYSDAISAMKTKGLLRGYQDGTFKPDKTVNRAELIKMLLDVIEFSPIGKEFNQCFSDVFNQWYAPYVCQAKRKNWVTGYPDKSFRPDQAVTRAEGITLAARVVDLLEPESSPSFNDVESDAWFGPSVGSLEKKKLLPFTGTRFFPHQGLDRGEVAGLLDAISEERAKPVITTDVPAGPGRNLLSPQ